MEISILPLQDFRCLYLGYFLIDGGGDDFVFIDPCSLIGRDGDGVAVEVELDVDGVFLHQLGVGGLQSYWTEDVPAWLGSWYAR